MNAWVEKILKVNGHEVHKVQFKFAKFAKITFLDYRRSPPYVGVPMGVTNRLAGYVTTVMEVDGLPTYNIVLAGGGLLRNVPERNLELYAEENNLRD